MSVTGLDPTARRRLLGAAGLGVLASGSAIGLLLTSGWLISRAAQHPPVLYLMVAIVAVRTFGVSRAVFRYAERLVGHDAVLRSMTTVRVRVFESLRRLGPAGVGRLRQGDLVSRAVSDVDAVQDRLLRGRLPWTVATVTAAATLGFTALLSAPATAAAGSALVSCWWLVPLAVRAATGRSQDEVAALRGELAAAVAELVRGADELAVLGAAGAGGPAAVRVRGLDARLATAQRRAAWTAGLGVLVVRVLVAVAVVGAALVGVGAVAAGTLSPVLLAVVVLAPLGLVESVEALPTAEQQQAAAGPAVRRLDGLKELPAPVVDPDRPASLPPGTGIVARGLTVRWPGGASDVVQGLDLDLPPGSRTALVGPSGVGKSTLAWTLLRLLDYRAGSLTLDGVELQDLPGAEVRRVVGLLGQDEHVFDTTIRENLRIADPDATDAQLLAALDQARLGAFVRGLPDGLDTTVGESGERLSGGERQRLGLARLLLGHHRVVVLDEPTEHLDEPTAAALTADLLALAPARTVVLITHRPHGLDDVDQVVRLERRTVEVAPELVGAVPA